MHEMQSSYQQNQKANKFNELHTFTEIYKTKVVITFTNE